mmetsp:Transcript_36392/g.95953  ORF Transcript_36392/g.95953 Transcript_36392/m.95953 type:complete len:209 (+) Transcript_36392:1849-2475(+)
MKYWSWERPMMMAAPEVKPEMTGCARNETRNPRRKKPAPIWKAPTRKDVMKASFAYSSGQRSACRSQSSFGSVELLCAKYSGHCSSVSAPLRPTSTRSETIATGPTPSWRDVPIRAYVITGSTEVYMPYLYCSPAMSAYDIDCGMSITPTVSPATRSALNEVRVVRGPQSKMGNRLRTSCVSPVHSDWHVQYSSATWRTKGVFVSGSP